MGNVAIDTAIFERLKAGLGEDFIVELVETYRVETPELIESLHKSLAAQDAETFRRSAHSIKSSSAALGALQLSGQARQLEMLGKSGEFQNAQGMLDVLAAEYDQVSLRLAEMIHGA